LLWRVLWNDLRYAARTLRNSPGFAAIAIVAIALGIGINTGIFSLLNSVALRPLPVPRAEQLISVYQTLHSDSRRAIHGSSSYFSIDEYETYRDQNQVFSGLLAYAPFVSAALGGETPRSIVGQYASCNYFDVLDEPVALGRTLQPSDCLAAGNGVVVLSDDLWRSAFQADPSIAGKTVLFNGRGFTVAGVAPPGFHGTEAAFAAFWVPLAAHSTLEPQATYLDQRDTSWLVLMGRAKTGIPLGKVRAGLSVIAARIDASEPGRKTTLVAGPATFASLPEVRSLVTGVGAIILAAVGLVLLVACANVANLLLARAAGRQREIAIRLTVGATRWRLVRQLMTESMLIAFLGGALGWAAAIWSFDAILAAIAAHLPKAFPQFALDISPDVRIFAFALAITVATGIVFGLAPALSASQSNINRELNSAGFLRQSLVGVQVAVCMILLIAAGLMLRALYRAQIIDPGFEMKNVTAISFDLGPQGYTTTRAAVFHRQLMDRLSSIPGVNAVAQTTVTPLSDSHIFEQFKSRADSDVMVEVNYVSPEYLALLNIPLVRGRDFTPAEISSGAAVMIPTESTARRLWPGQDPIGRDIESDKTQFQVIGVARDTQVSHIGRSDETYVYLPAGPKQQLKEALLVRAANPVSSQLRAALRAADPNLAVEIAPLEDNLEWWRTPSRLVAILGGSLGALALVLAAIGVYGVVSFGISRRIREIGIRTALGADSRVVHKLILTQAMRPVLIGAFIGIAACAAVSRILSSLLWGLSSYDPVAFTVVPVFLIAIALTASYIPARRATRIDPLSALWHE
jgi:macrolide transport system ATP-binding/permease protein